jgi:hypothetical protein
VTTETATIATPMARLNQFHATLPRIACAMALVDFGMGSRRLTFRAAGRFSAQPLIAV